MVNMLIAAESCKKTNEYGSDVSRRRGWLDPFPNTSMHYITGVDGVVQSRSVAKI